ncbi:MAG: hypothetical protein WBM71_02270 [Sedimenticolaceae bacterium]
MLEVSAEMRFVENGYLSIETHRDRPAIARFFLSAEPPDPQAGVHAARRIRYIARFNDRDAALMHVHEVLKRRLIDPDTHLYGVPVEHAIAAAESLDLKHTRIYVDTEFGDDAHASIAAFTERFRRNARRKEIFFQTLGYIGIGMLLFNLFFLSFP